VIETPRGAHFTECPPDYGRDEAFQREYAASAKDAGAWQAFFERYLSLDSEAEYQRAIASFAQRAEGERRPAGAK
jgi:glutaconate CoA-transferase subunit A